jgi:hypothetical protein
VQTFILRGAPVNHYSYALYIGRPGALRLAVGVADQVADMMPLLHISQYLPILLHLLAYRCRCRLNSNKGILPFEPLFGKKNLCRLRRH